jgi:hypothetical protein
MFAILNTGIHFRGAITDSFTVCRHISSILPFLMLSHPDSEVFWLTYQDERFPSHITWNCQNVCLIVGQSYAVITKAMFTSNGTDGDCF